MVATGHFRHLLLSSMGASALVSSVGTLLTSEGARGKAGLAALGLGALFGALLGLLQLGAVKLLSRPVAALAARANPSRFFDRSPEADRRPVVAFHAVALSLLVFLAGVALCTFVLLKRLASIENAQLMRMLAAIGVALIGAFGLAAAAALAGVFSLGLTRLDARVKLPLPPQPALRRIIWVALPLGAGAAIGLALLQASLGPLAAPLWILLVLAVQIVVVELGRAIGGRIKLPGGGARWLPAAVAALLAAGGFLLGERALARDGAAEAIERSQPGNLLVSVARLATDFDRDGASALFGDRDCAGFDAGRGPTGKEIPNNGIDEDCDGHDARGGNAIPRGPVYSGASGVKLSSPDIVWFVIDALRADHTGFLGYKAPTTPNLDALAQESLVFSHAYSQSSATMLSFPSMLTGVDPGRIQWHEENGRLQPSKDQPFIWERLGKKGYADGFVASEYFKRRLPGLLRNLGWLEFLDGNQQRSSATAAALAAKFIVTARQNKAPFFLAVYLPAPHAPYVEHGPGYPKFPKSDIGRYDEEISNADRYMGYVLDVLRADERWKNTIVIVNGDHGEEFNEHGGTAHARTCHVESLHVPLVVRLPGQKPARVSKYVGLIDIVPTLLEVTRFPQPEEGTLDGHSLLVSRYKPQYLPSDRPLFCSVVSQKAAQGEFFRRSVRSGQWKLMQELRGVQQTTLYDLEEDPREKNPVPLTGDAAKVASQLEGWLRLQLSGNLAEADLHD